MALSAGERLRTLRESLGLTIRDVEAASVRLAARHVNEDFVLSLSRLSDIETKGIVPSIYRLYTLAAIYRQDLREVLSWYGIDLNDMAVDLALVQPRRSHLATAVKQGTAIEIPIRMDPGFDLRRTVNIGRMIEQWGLVPLSYLAQFVNDKFTYGYIGTEDYTMYPILMPGSFLQIDEKDTVVEEAVWRSEYERPIYFVETREGYTCCWCSLKGDELVLQPHPLSPVPVRVLRHPKDAEVLGRVVAVAMRLSSAESNGNGKAQKSQRQLN